MIYDTASIQYDNSTITYDEPPLQFSVNEVVNHSEIIGSRINKVVSEISNHYESAIKNIGVAISETVSHIETKAKKVTTIFKETLTHTESIFNKIKITTEEVATYSEEISKKVGVLEEEIVTHIESLGHKVLDRLIGAIGIIKEFVRIGKKKENIQATNIMTGAREELNSPYIQYDDIAITYDDNAKNYLNFIASEKPVFKIEKLQEKISLLDKEDKPKISKL